MKETQVKKNRLNIWIWRNLPDCKHVVKLITAAQDGRLSLFNRIIMKIHLHSCQPCVNFLNQLKFLRRAMREGGEKILPEDDTSVRLSDEARERLKNKIKFQTQAP